MRGRWVWLGWWAAFIVLALLLARTSAGETRSEMRVSATVVETCRVALAAVAEAHAEAALPQVDCGRALRAPGAPTFRMQRCNRANRSAWCARLRERHPGYEIRVVRFD